MKPDLYEVTERLEKQVAELLDLVDVLQVAIALMAQKLDGVNGQRFDADFWRAVHANVEAHQEARKQPTEETEE